ncbi:MAG: hypothetical protein WKF66_10085 [Pedobacter sp.]
MSYSLYLIDETTRREHSHLTIEDECHYLMNYTARAGYNYSPENSMISNIKKKLDKKGTTEWQYKLQDMYKLGQIFRKILSGIVDFNETTIVPIPPSKTKSDPLYDNRLNRILNVACHGKDADIRDLIMVNESVDATHTLEEQGRPRYTIDEIKANCSFDPLYVKNVKPVIMLFDDVLTAGSHFKAYKEVIEAGFPDRDIFGVFIARRIQLNVFDL